MSGLRALDGKAFLGQDFDAVKLPTKYMSGSCSGLLHPNPELQSFRKTVSIYCGDFELTVSCLNRKEAREISFEHFIANFLRQRLHLGGAPVPDDAPQRFHFREERHAQELASMPSAEDATSYVESLPHRAPIDVLWEFSNFGCLLWDWQKRSLQQLGSVPGLTRSVYAPAVDGSSFIPRIFVDVPPELKKEDTDAVLQEALEGLKELPELRGGLSRADMSKLITTDVHALAEICQKHGTFGTAVLPGAFDPITGFLLKAQTGNEHEAFIETEEHLYFLSLFTS